MEIPNARFIFPMLLILLARTADEDAYRTEKALTLALQWCLRCASQPCLRSSERPTGRRRRYFKTLTACRARFKAPFGNTPSHNIPAMQAKTANRIGRDIGIGERSCASLDQ